MPAGSSSSVKENFLVPNWALNEGRVYTGIGSRRTPAPVLNLQTRVARHLAELDYWLVSGGAPGSDIAFYEGAPKAHTAFLPWDRFQDFPLVHPIVKEAYDIASLYHPNWDNLTQAARKLMARNCHQVLGPSLRSKSAFVLCWTPDGCEHHRDRTQDTGGTGQAISVASENDIPIYNMANPDWYIRLYEMHEINLYDIVNDTQPG